jgi:hypothetical protein
MGENVIAVNWRRTEIRAAPPIFGIRPCNNVFLIQVFCWKVIPSYHERETGKVHNLLITTGVSHCVLAIYIKRYLKAKEELWKLKYFTMQKNNLQKSSKKSQNPLRYCYSISNLKFHTSQNIIFKNPSWKPLSIMNMSINLNTIEVYSSRSIVAQGNTQYPCLTTNQLDWSIGRVFFARGISSGQKWWQTLLGTEFSCGQWEGLSMHSRCLAILSF